MSSTNPFSSSPTSTLILSRTTPKSNALAVGATPKTLGFDDAERKNLIASFETNTYVLDGKNYNITWNLKSVTKEQFVKALSENQVLKMGSRYSGSYSLKIKESQSHIHSINGKVMSSTSSKSTTVQNETGKSFHTLFFSIKSNMSVRITLDIGTLVTPAQTNERSNDSKNNENSNSLSSSTSAKSKAY